MIRLFAAITGMVATVAIVCLAGTAAAQQAYPNKPIRFIVPFAPGGGTTVVARLIGQRLTESWGQQVIVDNRPGGNSIIGTEAMVKSLPDGYTILLVNPAHVTTPLLFPTPYDAIRDFAPVATLAKSELVLVLHPSVAANHLQEFIALAKSRPGQINYSSSGTGGVTHLASEIFCMMAGVKMQHIPYKGGGPALTDLLGGQVQALFSPPVNAVPHIKSGKLKAIAITGATRLPALPQMPTFSEAGLPGFDAKTWHGIAAPAGTPKAIIDKLSSEIARSMAMPGVNERLDSQGLDLFLSTPEQFAALLKAELAKFARVIKAANIRAEN